MGTDDRDAAGESPTDGAQDADRVPTDPAQHPTKKRAGGGKKGARKPSQNLKDMRWVYRNPTTDPSNESQRICRDVLDKDRVEFLKLLRDLERIHAAGRVKSGTGSPAPGASTVALGAVELDKGEQTTREMIAKLLDGFQETKP